LESALSAVIPGRFDVIINTETLRSSTGGIKLIHVHGYVPKDKPNLEYRHNIILSEDEYHNLYMNSLHWSNHVQYDRFGFSTCLFIGFSMTDPSVRRLMDAAAIGGSNASHFCILRRS